MYVAFTYQKKVNKEPSISQKKGEKSWHSLIKFSLRFLCQINEHPIREEFATCSKIIQASTCGKICSDFFWVSQAVNPLITFSLHLNHIDKCHVCMDLMTNWICTLSSVDSWLCYTEQIKQILKGKAWESSGREICGHRNSNSRH